MWEPLQIERWVEGALCKQLGEAEGRALFGAYAIAREYLIRNVLEEIKKSEPDLSDHGPRHIQNVMKNASQLIWRHLAKDDELTLPASADAANLMPHEIFLLLVAIIFHDVGNVYKRNNHNNMILPVLKDAYPDQAPHFLQVRSEVKRIASAHTGLADGSSNTLARIGIGSLAGMPVRTRDLAAILRLADELAEGPHRTSEWRYRQLGYKEDSRIFHVYARCCQPPTIDPASGRIALLYIIDIALNSDSTQGARELMVADLSAKDILPFIYKRVLKLDQERKYNKHYSHFLTSLKETSVAFEFYYDGNMIPVQLDSLTLSDLIVPGEHSKGIADIDNRYAPERLLETLLQLCP